MSGNSGGRSDGYIGGGISRGGSGSTGRGGGSGGGGSNDPCAIFAKATINSPNAAVLSNVNVGDDLDVSLDITKKILVAFNGQTCGSLTFNGMANVIQCLEDSYNYKATLDSKTGGYFVVTLQPA